MEIEGTHGNFLKIAEIRACVQVLRGKLDEIIRLVESGVEAGSRMICCHKCGVGMEESPANGQQLASLVPKELSSNWPKLEKSR